jgi:O-antigen/teichoic acid export membrane protein
MVGTLVAVIFLYIKNKKIFLIKNTKRLILNIKKQLTRYKRFPIFNLPATLVNLSANQAPNMLLNSFGQNILGYFSLSQRILGSPITLFSSSITHVFKERASSDYRKYGSCRDIFIKTFKSLFLISIIPFVLIYIFSPKFTPIIFGSEWQITGIYIRSLTIMYFFKFTVSPLTYVIIIAEKQNLNLILQSLLLISSVLSIGFGIINNNPLLSVKIFSISYSLMYIIFFTFSYKFSKNN